MSAIILDGTKIAAQIKAEVGEEVKELTAAGLRPGLAVVLAGHNPASEIYVRNKVKSCEQLGIYSEKHTPGDDVTTAELLALIDDLNRRDEIDGILVQLPLPSQVDSKKVLLAVSPEKDVDGFHPNNFGRLAAKLPTLIPCTPIACIKLANSVRPSLDGLDALVIGRSNIVGNPLGQLLMAANATVTIAHTHTRNLPDLCRRAELLFVAIGHAEYIRGDWIKPGATVVDVGINRVPGPDGKSKIVGDVCFAEALEVAGAITPVPGGVGPMTIVCLLANTLRAACLQAHLPPPEV